MAVHDLVPHQPSVLRVVGADGDDTRADGVELFSMSRELAQLAGAIGSPMSAIKDQKHAFTTERGETIILAELVLQHEIRRRFALRRSNLRPGQDLRHQRKL